MTMFPLGSAAALSLILFAGLGLGYRNWRSLVIPRWTADPPPLVLKGGDPHIRALMRTISASEANYSQPYSVIYGGRRFQDLSNHPDRCVPIQAGPNVGDCTTAAGRYQFITTTWLEKARMYHPVPSQWFFWETYSFEPQYQDAVIYRWLSDPQAWNADLSRLLKEGEIEYVLWLLSDTWTSLGYGIETNFITDSLPEVYQTVLQEELDDASDANHQNGG
ncbi:MAG: glycoside hydrolase family 24 protein [Elainellaceae cyanobacterium]